MALLSNPTKKNFSGMGTETDGRTDRFFMANISIDIEFTTSLAGRQRGFWLRHALSMAELYF